MPPMLKVVYSKRAVSDVAAKKKRVRQRRAEAGFEVVQKNTSTREQQLLKLHKLPTLQARAFPLTESSHSATKDMSSDATRTGEKKDWITVHQSPPY